MAKEWPAEKETAEVGFIDCPRVAAVLTKKLVVGMTPYEKAAKTTHAPTAAEATIR